MPKPNLVQRSQNGIETLMEKIRLSSQPMIGIVLIIVVCMLLSVEFKLAGDG